jgi:hypothetical protein
MAPQPIPDDLRRFVLTSIASVPHLEALLLLRSAKNDLWNSTMLAERLYIGDKLSLALLQDLCRAGMTTPSDQTGPPDAHTGYRYQPCSDALATQIDRLAALYGSHLLEVTYLIHSTLERKAHLFADAFKWRKDP